MSHALFQAQAGVLPFPLRRGRGSGHEHHVRSAHRLVPDRGGGGTVHHLPGAEGELGSAGITAT